MATSEKFVRELCKEHCEDFKGGASDYARSKSAQGKKIAGFLKTASALLRTPGKDLDATGEKLADLAEKAVSVVSGWKLSRLDAYLRSYTSHLLKTAEKASVAAQKSRDTETRWKQSTKALSVALLYMEMALSD